MSYNDDELPTQPDDLYHHGVITKLFPSNNMGFIRTESGREVPFSYEFVILCGGQDSLHDLKEGQAVGYDLGWTPKGLRITKIKAYEPPAPLPQEKKQES
ncbi:MAG TPA: hypothetical protein VE131_10590 [Terriglobales bacterium]|nr:hypothetical protein [Terriglobales bacterium]